MAVQQHGVALSALVAAADEILEPSQFSDYCPNGLQVEGRAVVRRIVCGVTASLALIEAAIAREADAILVHHGYFWRGESPVISGMKRRRLGLLLEHNISLLAYHLPLDAHPLLGNNAQLALRLGIQIEGGLDTSPRPVGNVGRFPAPLSVPEFASKVEDVLGRRPLVEQVGDHTISRIAWCTGGAQSYIDRAAQLGVDAYLTGEVSEPTILSAREQGLHFFAAGHHATERYGVMALGAELAERFGLQHEFIDIDNPA